MAAPPLVSVLLTTRDRVDMLAHSLGSVRAQTYRQLEIIVVDDASADGTAEYLRQQASQDGRIRVLRNDRPLGSNGARNRGLRSAGGRFIAGLDDDDRFLPGRIEKLLAAYDQAFALVTSNNLLVYDDGREEQTHMPAVVSLRDMAGENLLMNQALIERRRLLDVGGFDEDLSACQDYDLWMRLMLAYGDAKTIPDLTQVVNLQDHRSRISTRKRKAFSGYWGFYRKYRHLMRPADRRKHLYRIYDVRNKPMSDRVRWILAPAEEREGHFARYAFGRLTKEHYRMFIDFVDDLGQVAGDKTYVLYGYGTLGRFLAASFGERIVAVMDKGLSLQGRTDIDGLPLIRPEQLSGYADAKLLLSAPLYLDAVSELARPYGIEIVCLPDLRLPWDKQAEAGQ